MPEVTAYARDASWVDLGTPDIPAPPRSTAVVRGTPGGVAGDRRVRELHVQGSIGGGLGRRPGGSAVLDHVRLGGERRRGRGQRGGSRRHHGRRADGRHDAGPNGDVPRSGRCTLLGLASGRPHRCRRRQRAQHALLERDGHAGPRYGGALLRRGLRLGGGRRSAEHPRVPDVVPGGRRVGGLLTMDENFPAGIPPHWMPFFAVDDVDAAITRTQELGGKAQTEAMGDRGMNPARPLRRAGRPPGRPLFGGGPGPGRPATLIDPIRSRARPPPLRQRRGRPLTIRPTRRSHRPRGLLRGSPRRRRRR